MGETPFSVLIHDGSYVIHGITSFVPGASATKIAGLVFSLMLASV